MKALSACKERKLTRMLMGEENPYRFGFPDLLILNGLMCAQMEKGESVDEEMNIESAAGGKAESNIK